MPEKLPNIIGIIDKQTAGAQRITTWFALLALIILTAEIILIIAMFLTPVESVIYNWFVPIILLFLLVFVAAYFYERRLGVGKSNNEPLKKIEKMVKGYWFEFIHNHEKIAFSVSEIIFDSSQMQFVLKGTSYTTDAKKAATWTSTACAVTNLSVPEFYYFWEGEHFSPNDSDMSYSGIGVIKFPSVESGKQIQEGSGWFTSGNISELKFSGRYKIDFIRCTKDEIEKLNTEGREKQEFFKERYLNWRESFVSD